MLTATSRAPAPNLTDFSERAVVVLPTSFGPVTAYSAPSTVFWYVNAPGVGAADADMRATWVVSGCTQRRPVLTSVLISHDDTGWDGLTEQVESAIGTLSALANPHHDQR